MYVASLLFVSIVSLVSIMLDCLVSVACLLPVCGLGGSSAILALIQLTMICFVMSGIQMFFHRALLLQAIQFCRGVNIHGCPHVNV